MAAGAEVEPQSVAESGPAGARPEGAYAIVAWLARHHGQPFSSSAIAAKLPAGFRPSDRAGLARALEAVGLKSRLVERKLKEIDPAVLPCLVFRKDGHPLVLLRLAPKRRVTVIDPMGEEIETETSRAKLQRDIGDEVMLVAPLHSRSESRLTPQAQQQGRSARHWLWGPVRDNWSAWFQILLAAFCLNVLNLALPIFVMNVYDRVIPNLAFVTLWTLGAGVAVALILDLAMRTLRTSVLEALARRVDLRIAASLFDQVMNIRLTSRAGGAAGMANAVRDFESVRDFFGSASFVALIDLLFIGVFIAALFFVVGPLAWVPLLAIPVVLTLAIIAQIPLGRSAGRAQQLATKRHVVLVESLLGIEAIKSLNAEPVMQREWETAVAASSRISGRTRFWSGLATNGTLLTQQTVSVGIILWGVYLVSDGQITVGALIAANILAGRVLAPLAAISQTIFRAQYAIKSMSALDDIMKLPRERSGAIRSNLQVTQGVVELRDVTYAYPEAEHPALAGVSISIAPGEVVALLGRVGSGKTTTGKLLNGLLEPADGNILIDGHGIAQYDPAELRDGIGYLTQESELFTGTLRENLTIGRPDATEEEIRKALWLAGMDAFTAANPEGLDLFIGEKGNRLSGGQRQGVALARLFLRQPKVLFLDEPTNAMDQQMETAVIERLRGLGGAPITLILCTHRMSLANIADRFIVLDKGRKVLDGPRGEVIERLRAGQPARVEG